MRFRLGRHARDLGHDGAAAEEIEVVAAAIPADGKAIAGKLLGAGCFFVPFSFILGTITGHLTFLWIVALAAAAEMVAIQLWSDHGDPDIPFLCCVKHKFRCYKKVNFVSSEGAEIDKTGANRLK